MTSTGTWQWIAAVFSFIASSWMIREEAARELESETGYSKRAADAKPKQEAAVKGITPASPAPSAAPPREAA
ncbi:hypothetical protein PPH41_03260, partial [Burkholderia gladioli]|nr:hypothetical protein [Burkholderia gladioli]